MSYDTAKKHGKANTAYRLALREARTVAVQLGTKLMKDALEGRIVNADGNATVPKEAIQAMAETLREAREVFGEDAKKPRRNTPGAPVNAEEALRELES